MFHQSNRFPLGQKTNKKSFNILDNQVSQLLKETMAVFLIFPAGAAPGSCVGVGLWLLTMDIL